MLNWFILGWWGTRKWLRVTVESAMISGVVLLVVEPQIAKQINKKIKLEKFEIKEQVEFGGG